MSCLNLIKVQKSLTNTFYMHKTTTAFYIIVCFVLLGFTFIDYSCVNLPVTNYNYASISFPTDVTNNITEMDNMPANNVTTDAGATLGRVLFYDVALSKNYSISCASCHIQKFGFSDTARFSRGFNGGFTKRNSMGLVHARFQKDSAFFWDNRAATLEAQVLMPIQDAVEMGLTLDTLVARVASKNFYPPLFQSAFGSNTVTVDRISKALAQFIRSINTFGSKFRQGVNTTTGNPSIVPFANFTAQENLGKDLFMDINRGNCQACHTRNVMVQQGSKNIGLDLVYTDNGVGAAFNNTNKNGQFSVPSLINVAITPPYMHDGRFKTLEQVIDFYSDSVKAHPNLDGFLREIIPGNPSPNNNPCNTCPPRHPHYDATEKAALVAFLKTLTDTTSVNDVRWSDPFCINTVTNVAEPLPLLGISIYPNPILPQQPITINLASTRLGKLEVRIINIQGLSVYRKLYNISLGSSSVQINNLKLPKGIYAVQANMAQQKISTKLVVAN